LRSDHEVTKGTKRKRKPPLPWREGIEGRGMPGHHPHPGLPPSRGKENNIPWIS